MGTERIINAGDKTRASNIEILRIIAMFFILFIHANFWSLGEPTIDEMAANPLATWCRTLFESAGIIAVNCFVFISGWFGKQTQRISKLLVSKFILLYRHNCYIGNGWNVRFK